MSINDGFTVAFQMNVDDVRSTANRAVFDVFRIMSFTGIDRHHNFFTAVFTDISCFVRQHGVLPENEPKIDFGNRSLGRMNISLIPKPAVVKRDSVGFMEGFWPHRKPTKTARFVIAKANQILSDFKGGESRAPQLITPVWRNRGSKVISNDTKQKEHASERRMRALTVINTVETD